MTDTATAHAYWNKAWTRAEDRAGWETPEADIEAHARTLAPGSRVLDLGAGIGRHALMYAALGHRASALDAAPDGMAELARRAETAGLSVATTVGPMDALPYGDGAFDHVLAFNVVYHGDEAVIARTVAEVHRVLRPGGTFGGTFLSHRRLAVEQGKWPGTEISPNTWVFEAEEGDKAHPHTFSRLADVVRLLAGFELYQAEDEALTRPEKAHWRFLAERLA